LKTRRKTEVLLTKFAAERRWHCEGEKDIFGHFGVTLRKELILHKT